MSIRGTENWYPVQLQEIRAKYWALKMGATVISRGPFEAWKSLNIVLFGKEYYIYYGDNFAIEELSQSL